MALSKEILAWGSDSNVDSCTMTEECSYNTRCGIRLRNCRQAHGKLRNGRRWLGMLGSIAPHEDIILKLESQQWQVVKQRSRMGSVEELGESDDVDTFDWPHS